jgi:hypothetical protein
MTKNFTPFVLLVFLICVSRMATAQTIHLIAFGDTEDIKIGGGTKVSITFYDQLAQDVVKYAGFQNYNKQIFEGKDFSKQNLEQTLSSLAAKPEDVILFYTSCHGYNDDTSPFPRLVMESRAPGTAENSVNLSTIYDKLMQKNARLTIVLGEACNTLRDVRPEPGIARTATHPPVNVKQDYYRELFRRSQMGIIACSSQKGQLSVSNKVEGGRFTQALFDVMGDYLSNNSMESPSWEKVLTNTKTKTRQLSSGSRDGEQTPYFEFENRINTSLPIEPEPKSFAAAPKAKPAKPVTKPTTTVTQTNATLAPAVKPAAKPATSTTSKTTACYNRTSYESIRTYTAFVESYWKNIDKKDVDDAREMFASQVYTKDRTEFYENILEKLAVKNYPEQEERIKELGASVLEILGETEGQLNSPNFKLKASSKLAMVVSDLKNIVREIDSIDRACRER